MSTMNSVVPVYDTHEQAEAAIKELQEGHAKRSLAGTAPLGDVSRGLLTAD
jgi:hypothetical protein